MKIANRKLGGLQDVISQYEIDDTEQITVRGEPARVACLNHAGFFKWLSNRHSGTPGYIKVDMNSQEAVLDNTIGLFGGTDVTGIVLINKRTKETHSYSISGAEEFSAMRSAEGAVQHLGYTSTFPLLLKIENQPTYLVSLKDSGGLVKMYGMVNVAKYQIVATGNSISDTLSDYKRLLRDGGVSTASADVEEVAGIIEDIKETTIAGNSNYFIKLKNKNTYYILDILDNKKVGILNVGDHIKLSVEASTDDIIPAKLK